MRSWRALWAAFAIWAFLGWAYVCARLLNPAIGFEEPFIEGIPVAFWMMAIGAFLLGFVATWRALIDGSD